jgi:hypothetical protein
MKSSGGSNAIRTRDMGAITFSPGGAVTEPHAVRRLLAALGLAAEPPPGTPVSAA